MAETTPTGGQLAELVRVVAPFLPGIAGAVLGMMFGDGLTVRGKALSFATGLCAAVFVGPAIVQLASDSWPWGQFPSTVGTAIIFLTGVFGMVFLSGTAHAVAKYSRDPLKLVRIQAGPVTIGGEK